VILTSDFVDHGNFLEKRSEITKLPFRGSASSRILSLDKLWYANKCPLIQTVQVMCEDNRETLQGHGSKIPPEI